MSLNDLINIQVSVSATAPSQAGFGVPLIASFHNLWPQLIRYYTSLAGMVSDGFTVNSDAYKAAAIILDQSPTVTQFAVGRRTSQDAQILILTLTSANPLDTYTATFVDSAGVSHNLSVASTGVPATDSVTVATAITGFALAGTTVTHTGATVTLTRAANGLLNDVQNWYVNGIIQLADTTTDPGLTADLTAIYAADPSGWYGLCLGNNSPALVKSAMAWVESNKKLGAFNCSDTAIGLGTGGNVALQTQTLGYTRSAGFYSGSQLLDYAGAGALGRNMPPQPGSITWMWKNIVGVPTDNLSQTFANNITAASWNYFTSFKGARIIVNGWSPAGEYMDIVQGIDWFTDLMQTDLLALFVGTAKVPFTDAGGDTVLATMKADLHQAVQVGLANPGDATTAAPVATVPKVATISASNRAKRAFVGSTWSFVLAGAIHSLTVTGTVTS